VRWLAGQYVVSMPETSPQGSTTNLRSQAVLFLLLTAPIPILGTSLAMVWQPDAVWPKVVFFVAKLWLFAAPVVWLLRVEKTKTRMASWIPRWRQKGMLAAHATGIVIFVSILIAYLTVGRAWIDVEPMVDRIRQMKLDNAWLYLAGALYWCTVNSLLEEYYWRWFVFRRLEQVLPAGWGLQAAVLSGLLFTAHHVVALKVFFDWPMAILASTGVFIGGVTWSVLYKRFENIYCGYVSHVYADVIIFGIGAWLVFGGA